MDNNIKLPDRVLIASSYVFAFPSLYIILSEKRKETALAFHAAQAMFLWMFIAAALVFLRIGVNYILSNINIPLLDKLVGFVSFILWLYAVYCAILFLLGKDVKIPLITQLTNRLA